MKIKIEIDEKELRAMVKTRIRNILGDVPFDEANVTIETKSKQNYRAEWESGAGFRATYEVSA